MNLLPGSRRHKNYTYRLLLYWTVVILVLLTLMLIQHRHYVVNLAENEARDYSRLNLDYRAWAARMGGVYVPIDKAAPNPHLVVQGRDVTTTDGRHLTLINPAYMTRMVFEDMRTSSQRGILSKLTSLKPLNPVNAPDEWERAALDAFEQEGIVERSQITAIEGKPYMRLISRFVTEKPCLKCHEHQGYKEGDVRGGITISIPLSEYYSSEVRERGFMIGGFMLLWALVSWGILSASRKYAEYENRLLQSEERFRTVCDWTQDWEYWVNPSGNLEYISPSCEKFTGYSVADFSITPSLLMDVVHADDRHLYAAHRCSAIREISGSDELKFRIIRKDGEIRWIQHLCRSVVRDNVNLGRRVSNRDITDLVHAAQERQKIELQLLQSQKLESLGILAGGIAHDFNNILMAIIGNAELARMRVSPDSPAIGNLQQIDQAACRAADLAKQMLAYSGKGNFLIETLDLNLLLEEMLPMLEVSISKKALLRLNQAPQLPAVDADATQLRQIIMNMVINASEAIGDDNGEIAITTGFMECDKAYLKDFWLDEGLAEGMYVFLVVTDSGCGMDKDTMSKLFDPFFTTKFTGRGLGMAAVQGIVRGHKGGIKVYSNPGQGSTFQVLLPVSSTPAEIAIDPTPNDVWTGSGTVLLVDDEPSVRNVGAEMLLELGFKAITASNGREALEIYKNTPGIFCVILDLTMPQMGGVECFRELQKLDPGVNVVMTSGYSEQEVTERFVNIGVTGFIQKPYNSLGLKNVLKRVLS
ncbi:MAG: DUF3365 domain-containing protein [Geobacteraceae bacterium]|nr:DUF3365 domain-containing protein [Geobacteraceae bacterium]